MKRSPIRPPCAYCGKPDARERDHPIPKELYPSSKATSRIQRIRIYACHGCNNGWASDEAHFRNVMLVSGEPTPIVRELWEGPVRRSFDYRDGRKRARDL